MCQDYSQIYSATYLGLGQPDDSILSRLELGNILTRRLSYRLESVRQSEQGVSISKSAEFTLQGDQDEIDLTDEIPGFVIPMWIEAQVYTYVSHPVWRFVPTVNISYLQQMRAEGTPAVAFYGDNPLQVKAKFSYFGNETFTANMRKFRVWYLPEVVMPSGMDEQIALPNNLVNILTYDCFVSAIPLMKMNISKQLGEKPDLAPQLQALDGLYVHYTKEQAEMEHWFEKWKNESRGSHRPRNRRDVLSWMRSGNMGYGIRGGGGMS